MNTFLFIMVAMLLVGFRYYKAKLRQMADQEDSSESANAASKSAFESLFDVHSDGMDSAASTRSSNSSSYFSYETSEDSPECEVHNPKNENLTTADTKEELSAEPVNVDLRQAVIYQTILSNKYLDEMQSLDN